MEADVVVVGAGAAGLAAALRLADCGLSAVVVDARDAIGGRVHWQNVGSTGVPSELGAEFIHGAAPQTSALLRTAGLTAVETGEESWRCDASGRLARDDDDVTSDALFKRAASLAQDESVDAFLRRCEHDPHVRDQAHALRSFVEGFEAADPALASIRSIADEVHTGIDSTSARPVGSYAPLFTYLASRCARAGIDIRLRTTVSRIAWSPGNVAIETHGPGGSAPSLHGRAAVITAPVGVLRQPRESAPLSFSPSLPEEKLTALGTLEMGHVVRVVLAFNTSFWDEIAGGRFRDAGFFRCEAGGYNAFWTQMPLRGRTIAAWAGGPRAIAMQNASSAERIERALAEFGAMIGEPHLARREFEEGATHDWSRDPFACGAYSYVTVGGGSARAMLGAPVAQTLFFAGEATSTDGQGGTVSGAFETGTRAADEAADALGRTTSRIGVGGGRG